MKKKSIKHDFDFHISEYLYYCQSRRLRRKTIASYDQTLRLFERWAMETAGITTPEEVREQTIRHYICDLQERGKYSFYADEKQKETNHPERRRDFRQPVSVTTINNYIRNLRAFFNWFYYDRLERDNPMRHIRQLENTRSPREYLEDNEVQRLLNNFDKSYFPEYRDSIITMLILDSGMRLGECLLITTDQISITERVIEIPAEHAKGRKSRSVFFSIKTARALQRWLQYKDRYIETSYLFPVKATGLPLEIRTFETNFKRYITRSGITKDISPHALRNNFAKRCILAGMDIYSLSRILGHSSVTVTEQAYTDLTNKDLMRCYQSFSPIENMGR